MKPLILVISLLLSGYSYSQIDMQKYDSIEPKYIYQHGDCCFLYQNHIISNREMHKLFENNPTCLNYYNKSITNNKTANTFGAFFFISGLSALASAFGAKEYTNYFLGAMGVNLAFGIHFNNRQRKNLDKAVCAFNQTK